MKLSLLFFIFFFISGAADAFCLQMQAPDSLLLSHYPVDTGNSWDYQGGADQTWWNRSYPALMLKTVKEDTVLQDGKLYWKINVDEYGLDIKSTAYAIGYHNTWTEFIRIDTSTLEVYLIKYSNILKQDSLRAKVNDSFRAASNTIFDTVIFKDTTYANLFGTRRHIRHLREKQGTFDFKTAEGIGEIWRVSGSENYFSYYSLSGAVIGHDTLGSLLRIQDAGLKASHAKLVFNQLDTVQTVSFSNNGKGLAIIDSVKIKNSEEFYSYPSYRGGYYRSSIFSESPFPVFPGDHVEYNIYLKPEKRTSGFIDTLKIYSAGINGKKIPEIKIPVVCNIIIDDVEQRLNAAGGGFELQQNYPNPFNPVTRISFSLPEDGDAELKVFDIRGNLVETLVRGYLKAGRHSVKFSAENLSSGVYFYQLRAGGFIQNKKLVILK